MEYLRKYATATHVYIPIIKRAVVDFAVSADWTPVAGDVKISIDGGAASNVTNLPSAITMGNGAKWDFSLTTGELTGKKIDITVVDSATKAVEDQMFSIITFGNASAEYPVDFSDAVAFGLSRIDATISSRMASATLPGLGADNKVLISTDAQDLSGTLSVNAKKIGATTQTGRDLGLSVLLSAGTGTGQLDFTSGVVKSNLVQILATALTETAGLLAGGFKKFFNVASPTLTCLGVDQTGDSFARLGAPSGASIDADILSRMATFTLPTNFSSLAIDVSGRVDLSKVLGSTINALISGRLDVNVQAMATAVIASATFAAGAIDSAAMATSAENAIADALLDRANGIETGLTVRGSLRLCASALAGVLSGAATTTVTINNAVANAKARITATVDANGNRSAVSTDVT